MQDTLFDVAVVGGGIMGSAAAYHCARLGLRTALLERFELGCHARGSSHGLTRIVRRSYPSPLYTSLMRRAYELWADAEAEVAGCAGLEGPLLESVGGGLDICAGGSTVLAELRAACAAAGAPLEDVSPADARRRYGLELRDDEVAIFQRDTCVAAASRAVAAFQALARSRGAELLSHAEVESVVRSGTAGEERAWDVATADGRRVRARRVVVCPGPWAAPLLRRLFGLELPSLRVWQCTTMFFRRREGGQPPLEALPVLINYGGRPLWSRRNGGGGEVEAAVAEDDVDADADADADAPIYSCPVVGDPSRAKFAIHRGVETSADGRDFAPDEAGTVAPVQAWLRARLPNFDAESPEDKSTCLYTMTPDEDFIIDELDGEHAGIVVACGFSGHGFKFGPLIGAWLAAMASGRGADASVEALGPGVIVAEARAAFSLSRAALRLRKGAA